MVPELRRGKEGFSKVLSVKAVGEPVALRAIPVPELGENSTGAEEDDSESFMRRRSSVPVRGRFFVNERETWRDSGV